MKGGIILIKNREEEQMESCAIHHSHLKFVKRVENEIPKEELLYDLADFFKVFGDTTRIKILYVLRISEMCVCDITETLKMTQSAISHQLRLLKQMDLVKTRREGKTIYYSLADNHIASILDVGLEHISE